MTRGVSRRESDSGESLKQIRRDLAACRVSRLVLMMNGGLMSVFDPSALVEERISEELEPLHQRLDETTDQRERRSIEREMLRRERAIRKGLSGNSVAW